MREHLAVAALLLIVLAACAEPAGPASRPSPTAPSPVTTSSRYGAPAVERPRELRGPAPCRLLTADRLAQFGYRTEGTPRVVAGLAPGCVWTGDRGRRLSVAVVLDRDYLADVYRNRVLPVFRPVEISGLPAVEEQTEPNSPFCDTTVGVADHEALDVSITGDLGRSAAPDPCAEGRRVVEAIVATLPPKRG